MNIYFFLLETVESSKRIILLFDICYCLQFIRHKELPHMEHFTNKDFKRSIYNTLLTEQLVAVSQKSRRTLSQGGPASRKPHINENIRLMSSNHQPLRTSSRRCGNCSTKKNPVRSIWECSVCNVSLCMKKTKNCFQEFYLTKGEFLLVLTNCLLCFVLLYRMFSCILQRHIHYYKK